MRRMMSSGLGAIMLVVCFVPEAVGQPNDAALTNADIVKLTESGMPAEVIVTSIASSPTAFDMSVEELVALLEAGVDGDVIEAMLLAGVRDVSRAATPAPARAPTPARGGRLEAPAIQEEASEPAPAVSASIEGGATTVSATGRVFGRTYYAEATGVFFGGSVWGAGHERTYIYGAVHNVESTTSTQLGGGIRLGSADWIARPVARAGMIFASGEGRLVFGGGAQFGRRIGGLVTLDVGFEEDVTYTIAQLGGYYSFDGD